jgi:hypothetical protein
MIKGWVTLQPLTHVCVCTHTPLPFCLLCSTMWWRKPERFLVDARHLTLNSPASGTIRKISLLFLSYPVWDIYYSCLKQAKTSPVWKLLLTLSPVSTTPFSTTFWFNHLRNSHLFIVCFWSSKNWMESLVCLLPAVSNSRRVVIFDFR